jgi:glycosyltransferase involved in cell wall biosynthesis
MPPPPAAGIGERLHRLGQQRDVAALMSAFDLLVLTSAAEGMPTVIGEAMSAGVPCVTTDVGDARELVGDTGAVVPVGDAQAIAEAAVRLLQPGVRARLGGEARQRIQERYSLQSMVRSYEQLYESVLAPGAGRVAVETVEASGRV